METPPIDSGPSLVLRARVCMAKQGIRSVSALQRRLKNIGIEITSQHLGRLIDNKVQHLPRDVLAGLLNVLECSVADLIEFTQSTAS